MFIFIEWVGHDNLSRIGQEVAIIKLKWKGIDLTRSFVTEILFIIQIYILLIVFFFF